MALISSAAKWIQHRSPACLVLFIAMALAAFSPRTSVARTWRVPEDRPTIQAAIDASISGDTVSIASGVFRGPGNRDLDCHGKTLLIRSRSGATHTILDCEGRGRAFSFNSDESPTIEGLTLKNGYNASGGAVWIGWADPTFRDCMFFSNRSLDGGAVSCYGSATFEGCLFAGNVGRGSGGGAISVRAVLQGTPAFDHCAFYGNLAEEGDGGALLADYSDVTLVSCTVARNMSNGTTGGILANGGSVVLDQSICWGNCGSYGNAQDIGASNLSISCSDVDSSQVNAEQIIYGGPMICADPLFCDPRSCGTATTQGDYRLQPGSPCLPEGNPCGVLIGGLGLGCAAQLRGACCLPDESCIVLEQDQCADQHGMYQGDNTTCEPDPCQVTPTRITTWGRIKAGYR